MSKLQAKEVCDTMFLSVRNNDLDKFLELITVKRRTAATPIRPGALHTMQWNDAREKLRKYNCRYELSSQQFRDEREAVLMYKVTYGEGVPGYGKQETMWSPVEIIAVIDEGQWRIQQANF